MPTQTPTYHGSLRAAHETAMSDLRHALITRRRAAVLDLRHTLKRLKRQPRLQTLARMVHSNDMNALANAAMANASALHAAFVRERNQTTCPWPRQPDEPTPTRHWPDYTPLEPRARHQAQERAASQIDLRPRTYVTASVIERKLPEG